MYRNHNAGVLQDKLLVYNFKDGWGPLCEFLGEEVPDKPFPRANIGASIIREYMETHPIMIRMMREMMFSLGVITVIGVYGGYKIYRNPGNIKRWSEAVLTRVKFW
uniref:Uncharacterized protein n=1 Tax=Ciona savignyi TaxID=51511 RepID=H2Z271_CIOSA